MTLLKKYTIPHLLEYTFSKYLQNDGFSFVDGKQNTYADLQKEIYKVGNLLKGFDIQRGDKVAILATNSPQWVASYMAIAALGATVVPILPDFSDKEVAHILEHSEAKVLFISEKLYSKLPDAFSSTVIKMENQAIIPQGTAPDQLANIAAPSLSDKEFEYAAVEEEDLLAIIYTSGTTGSSKGVMLTHKNILWNLEQGKTLQPVNEKDRISHLRKYCRNAYGICKWQCNLLFRQITNTKSFTACTFKNKTYDNAFCSFGY